MTATPATALEMDEKFQRVKGLIEMMSMATHDEDMIQEELARHSWFRTLSVLGDMVDDIQAELIRRGLS